MSRTYATEPEFEEYLDPEPLPSGAAHLLRDASIEVDEMLFTAHYQVDHDDMPVDPGVKAALRDATCAQAKYRHEHGDEIDLILASEPVRLGPLSFGGTSGRGSRSERLPRFSPVAVRILRVAGLTPGVING